MQVMLNVFIGVLVPVATALVVYVVQRRVERSTLRCALLAEASTLLTFIDRHASWWREQQSPRPPLVPFATPVYDSQVANIGMLPIESVPDIVAFYSYVKFINALQSTRAAYSTNEDAFAGTYSVSLSNFLEAFRSKLNQMMVNARIAPLPLPVSKPSAISGAGS